MSLVGGQIVDDDDIARPQRWNETLLKIFDEDRSVHRAIDGEGARPMLRGASPEKVVKPNS